MSKSQLCRIELGQVPLRRRDARRLRSALLKLMEQEMGTVGSPQTARHAALVRAFDSAEHSLAALSKLLQGSGTADPRDTERQVLQICKDLSRVEKYLIAREKEIR